MTDQLHKPPKEDRDHLRRMLEHHGISYPDDPGPEPSKTKPQSAEDRAAEVQAEKELALQVMAAQMESIGHAVLGGAHALTQVFRLRRALRDQQRELLTRVCKLIQGNSWHIQVMPDDSSPREIVDTKATRQNLIEAILEDFKDDGPEVRFALDLESARDGQGLRCPRCKEGRVLKTDRSRTERDYECLCCGFRPQPSRI